VKKRMAKTKVETKTEKEKTSCADVKCPFHGKLKTRGRIFEGKVIKKFPKRIVIELERMVYISKYERYAKSRIRIHARLPNCIEKNIQIGDIVKVQECRPLSKIIHFVVIKKIKSGENQDSGGLK
jgi:small subunit ribosomal protein S17